MTTFTPTTEQTAIIDAFTTGDSVRVAAGAGTGKTTVLRMAAETAPTRRGLYVAFNKAIAGDAARVFGRNVKVSTTHSLAYHAIGHRYRPRLSGPRVPAREVATALRITHPVRIGATTLSPAQQTRLAQTMVSTFCASAEDTLTTAHLPEAPGLTGPDRDDAADAVLPFAQRLWADKTDPGGRLRFEHDDYLKMWALTRPDWGAEFVLFDEAQDTTPVVAAMVKQQQDNGAQVIVVGDSAQAIYGFRGAIDAMSMFDTPHRLSLTRSWRFGPDAAAEANKWLSILDAELRLTGDPAQPTAVTDDDPDTGIDAILCRTNAGVISRVVASQRAGRTTAVVGGGKDALQLAEAAQRLQAGQPTWHPDLAMFPTWGAVQDYADEDGGADLRPFVRLIDSIGADAVVSAIRGCVDEDHAQVTVGTAHKAKGREWQRVTVHDDFTEPDEEDRVDVEDAMLAYVTVTRARRHLHRGGLGWVDRWAAPGATPSRQEAPAPAPSSPALAALPAGDEETPVLDTQSLNVQVPSHIVGDVVGLAIREDRTTSEVVTDLLREALTLRGCPDLG